MYMQTQSSVITSTNFLNKVFAYFGLAILMSALGAFYAPAFLPKSAYGIVILLELALIFTSRMWSQRRPLNLILFVSFALLSGISIVPLLTYAKMTAGSQIIAKAFFATTGMCLGAAIYGKTTQRNLASLAGFLTMSLIGLIIVGILQIFFFSNTVEMISAGIGVIVFSGFIAYEVQSLKNYPENMAIEAALSLYLTVFNLFTSVLRLMLALSRD